MADADALKAQGNAAMAAGNAREAVEHYSAAIALAPSHALHSNRSAAHAALGAYEEALADGEQAVALKPDWGKGYARKALALEKLGRPAEALQAYEEGLRVEPSSDTMQKNKAALEAQLAQQQQQGLGALAELFSRPDLWQTLEENADTAALAKDSAFREKIAAIQANPASLTAHLGDADILKAFQALMQKAMGGANPFASAGQQQEQQQRQQQQQREAAAQKQREQQQAEAMEVEQSEEQQQAAAEKAKGNELYKARKFEEAKACYSRAVELDPTEMTYLTNRASAHLMLKEYEESIKDCQEAIEVGRSHSAPFEQIAKAYARIGATYTKMDRLEEAIAAYKSSLTENRDRAITKTLRKLEKKKDEAARQAYLDPEKAQEEKKKGNESFQANDFPTAIKHYTEAMKRDPSCAAFYSNRAAAYMKLGEFGLGLEDCDTCISMDPTFLRAYKRKVTILLFLKEFHTAVATLQAAKKVAPEDAELETSYQEVMTASQQYRFTAAKEDQEKRLAKAQQDPLVQALLRDPDVRSLLEAGSERGNPAKAGQMFSKPGLKDKFDILLASGVIGMGGGM